MATSSSSKSENVSKGKKVPMKPSRGWVITINNPVIPLEMYLKQWLSDGNIVFGCGQTEHPPGGTKHHQAYIVTKVNDKNTNGFGIKWMKDSIHSSAHFEPRRGTHEEARDYCTLAEYKGEKKHRIDGPWTVGGWSEEAAKAAGRAKGGEKVKQNCAQLMLDVKAGMDDYDIQDKYPNLYMQYYKAIERVRLSVANDTPRVQPYVVVFWGPTGTGKSHDAQVIMDNNGGGFTFRRGNSGNMWADGYDPVRHPVVVFDEMDGGFMPYRQLLRVTDKWQLVLDTKGGCVNFTPKIIVFTSSKHPKEWYSVEAVPDTTEMMRRLTGQYGAIINKTIPYAVVKDAGPDLADVLDLLMTGDLVEQMRSSIEQDDLQEIRDAERPPTWEEHVAANKGVDLTSDEIIDDEEFGEICGDCDRPEEYCECDGGHPEGFDDGYINYSPSQKYHDNERMSAQEVHEAPPHGFQTPRTTAATQAPPAPKKLKRQGAEFFISRPPSAPASEFQKLGLVQGQARLDIRKASVNVDDDDDVDDKQ